MKRYSILLLYVLGLLLFCISAFVTPMPANASITLRVGMYENNPKIFTDENGNPSGFWPDIIAYIASKEDWKIEYVQGTWTECLNRLENGQIDIMPDVAFTEARSALYDFSNEPVYTSWSRVYAKKETDIKTIVDLKDKRIAVLKGSINVEGPDGIKKLVSSFNISCNFIETDSYIKVFELVDSGEADAGVTSKDFGYLHEAEYKIVETAIIFQPASLYFAFPKGAGLTQYLIERIDNHVKELTADENSVYYQSLNRWLGLKPVRTNVIPGWIKWGLIGIGGLAVLLAGGSLILRSQVKARTKDLTAEIIERKRGEAELRKINRAMHTLSQSNEALVHSTKEPQLLDEVCRVIVQEGGYRLSWVGFVSQDQNKTVRPVAYKGYEEGFLDTLHITWADTEQRYGPISTAIRTGRPIVIQDIRNNPDYVPWREEALQRGYTSFVAIPLLAEKQNIGVLCINAAEPDAFSQEETGLLCEMANDLAYGIMSLRSRVERDRAEESLRTYLQMAPDGIYVSNAKGTFLYVNKRAEEISGYSKEELVGKSFLELDLIPEKYMARVRRSVEETAAGITTSPEELEIKRKDGTNVFVEISSTPVNLAGEYTEVGIVRDITERKRAEQEIRESETMLRAILDNTVDGILLTDPETQQFYTGNKAICRMLGYSLEEIVKMGIKDIHSKQDLPYAISQFERQVRKETILTENIPLKRKDGSVFYAEINNSEVTIRGKTYMMGILRDTTERMKGEEERKRLEEKAQISERLAAVGEMAAGIAHEINNPLTGVIGFSSMLLDEENIPEELKKDLTVIADGSQRVADIVKRLLTFARQTKPVRTLVNINDLIDNTLKLRDYVLKTFNIEAVTRLDPELPLIVADPGQLQQVFMNMIVNAEYAIKETGKKGTLTVTTEKHNNHIRISFQDNGIGIPRENMDRLFQPFFTTKKQGEGTGLGLSLSWSIVAEHGGEMRVESEPGHGTTFIIELPVTEIPASEIEVKTQTTTAAPETVKKSRILVVDDESGVRDFIDKALTRIGYSVETVSNAKEALDKIGAGNPYNVVFIDIRMPGMSGTELYQHILKNIPSLAGKIIFITGDVMGMDVSAFLKKYNLPYLVKPFTTEQLREIVDRFLGVDR
jgi:PAS domain S-box-containing protein